MKKRIERNWKEGDWKQVHNTLNALIQAQEEMEKRVSKLENWEDKKIDIAINKCVSEPKEVPYCICEKPARCICKQNCNRCGKWEV